MLCRSIPKEEYIVSFYKLIFFVNVSIDMNVIIFGAGIAGLTVAHELLERGYNVTIYEKSDAVGGFAQSRRDKNYMPTEYSWRAYAPFYANLFDITTLP